MLAGRRVIVGRILRPQQVNLWVRMGGKPFPHIHTYTSQNQAGPWCTQLQILDLHVLELDPLNFEIFLIFHLPKRVLSTRSSKSTELYPIKTCFVFKRVQICNFCLRRARPGIRRPWTCSCSHTYMQCSDPQIHLLWPRAQMTNLTITIRINIYDRDFAIESDIRFVT